VRAGLRPGLDVVVSKALPLRPGPGEIGRRIVRHGLADVLAWLGEKVGPRPEDLTHAVGGIDPAGPLGGVVFVSQEYADRLRAEATLYARLASPDRVTRQAAEAEWLRVHRKHRAAEQQRRGVE
jgi:hypothetical protein